MRAYNALNEMTPLALEKGQESAIPGPVLGATLSLLSLASGKNNSARGALLWAIGDHDARTVSTLSVDSRNRYAPGQRKRLLHLFVVVDSIRFHSSGLT